MVNFAISKAFVSHGSLGHISAPEMIFFLLIPFSLFFRLMTEISLFNVMDTVSEESEDEIVRYICNEIQIQS